MTTGRINQGTVRGVDIDCFEALLTRTPGKAFSTADLFCSQGSGERNTQCSEGHNVLRLTLNQTLDVGGIRLDYNQLCPDTGRLHRYGDSRLAASRLRWSPTGTAHTLVMRVDSTCSRRHFSNRLMRCKHTTLDLVARNTRSG